MKQLPIINSRDVDTGDEGSAIVKYDDSAVAVTLSLRSDGDVQVVMPKQAATPLREALRIATDQ